MAYIGISFDVTARITILHYDTCHMPADNRTKQL